MQARRKNSFQRASVLRERREALLARLREAQGAGVAGRSLSAMCADGYDAILREAFDRACLAIGPGLDAELVAVGSYGRRTLGPFSDVDVRIIAAKKGAELADALLYPLWDAGFPVGHQVLDLDEAMSLAEQDLATATSILDMRHLAGTDRGDDFALEAAKHLGRRAHRLIEKLAEDAAERQERFGDSPYLLEPEVKLGTGGLRDLDAIRWAAKLRSAGLPDLSAAEELMLSIRNRLHLIANRRSVRLSFDAQETIGLAMGYSGGRDPLEDRAV